MRALSRLPYDTIFTTVYAGLKINLCLVAASLPLLAALGFTGSPMAAWPFFTLLSAICGPAVAAAFATFRALSDGDHRVGRSFWRAYRSGFGRSLAIAALAALAVIVLAVDFRLALGGPLGAVTPVLALLIVVVMVVTTAVLATGESLAISWPRLLMACAYLSVRRWYLSLATLAVLGVLAAAVVAKPAVGLLLLPAPTLYVVWANTRFIVAPLLAVGRGHENVA